MKLCYTSNFQRWYDLTAIMTIVLNRARLVSSVCNSRIADLVWAGLETRDENHPSKIHLLRRVNWISHPRDTIGMG